MNVYSKIIEAAPSIRWKVASLISNQLYSKGFGAWGKSSTIVAPLKLTGVSNIYIGNGVAVFEGVWLATELQGKLVIGDNVSIGHSVHIHAVGNVTVGTSSTIVGGMTISNGAHNQFERDSIWPTGDITIGSHCFIGEQAVILGGVTIGDGAIIGANAVVTRDVPAGSVVAGVPATNLTKNL